jgi:ABC-type uncharacterized transport system
MGATGIWSTILLIAALLLTYGGERIAEAGPARVGLSAVGVLLALAAVAWRFARTRSVKPEAQPIEKALLGLGALVLGALAMYFAQSDAFTKLDGQLLSQGSPVLAGALGALWPAVLTLALFPTVLMELAYAAMAKAPRLELGRVRESMYALASALIFAFSLQYVLSERDVKKDFSYFRTAKPGEASLKLAESLDEVVQVTLWFPPANDVAEQVVSYFDELKANAPKLQVTRLDQAMEPLKSKELGVSGNGMVTFALGGKKETLVLGTDLEKTRSQLRSLDQDVQKKLLQVAKSKRTIYLTSGHGERGEDPLIGGAAQRSTVSLLREALKAQNYDLKPLSSAEGLGSEVPRDAAAVLVLGPTQSFSDAEAKALEVYGQKGGKLLFALDPEAGLTFEELLKPLGLKFTPVLLANDSIYAKKTYTPSDRTILGTRGYSSHPSVTSNSRNGYPMILAGAGALEELSVHPAEVLVDFPVRAEPQTFNDLNGNFNFDPAPMPPPPPAGSDAGVVLPPMEVRKAFGLGAVVTRRAASNKLEEELRALVLGDSDAVADDIIQQARGNQSYVVDGLKWLLGEDKLSGSTNSEVDVPITRTRKEDVGWFYATVFLAPALVLGAGFFARRRAKGGAR